MAAEQGKMWYTVAVARLANITAGGTADGGGSFMEMLNHNKMARRRFIGVAAGAVASGIAIAAKGETKREMDVVGFSCAVLLSIIFIILSSFVFLSFKPELLISELSVEQKDVASRLLLILACSTPVLGLLRVTQVIYSIRVVDYEFQFIQLIANLVKIASTYYFFSHGNYNVVGYFLFVQIMNLLVLIVSWFLLKSNHNYKLFIFLKTIRFSKEIFNEV